MDSLVFTNISTFVAIRIPLSGFPSGKTGEEKKKGSVEIVFLSVIDGGVLPPESTSLGIDSLYGLHLIRLHLLSKGLIASWGPGVQPPVEYPE